MKLLVLFSWAGLLSLHYLGVFKNLNVSLSFYDMVLHFLGGALASLTIIVFFKNRGISRPVFVFTAVMIIGVFWEIFEMLIDIFMTPNFHFPINMRNVSDSLSDLFFDGLGSVFLIIISNAFRKH